MNELTFHVYILASNYNGTLYVGATDNLVKRVWEHRTKVVSGFTKRYNVTKLVWYEQHLEANTGLLRERRIKHWLRAWKIALIEKENPKWGDLWDEINIM